MADVYVPPNEEAEHTIYDTLRAIVHRIPWHSEDERDKHLSAIHAEEHADDLPEDKGPSLAESLAARS